MSRRHNGNNAFALASGSRLAADSTHGVTCTFTGGCRVFDANISKKHEMHWRCEHHGGVSNSRANAKDEDCRDGLPGAERRARFARVRNKQRKSTATFHIPSFLDKPTSKAVLILDEVTPKTAKPKISAKQQERNDAMELLGLTEEQVADFLQLMNVGNQ